MKNKKTFDFKFIDLFAGIGGFHIAMHEAGGKCVFASEWDKFARQTYEHNYKKISPDLFKNGHFNEDINNAKIEEIPDFDLLCAGFPCQPFSHAGLKKGFEDTRGTLFFKMAEIIDCKIKSGYPPKVLLLENVKGLKSHDKGRTLKTIIRILEEMGYNVVHEVLNSKYFGVPQNRERIFIVAYSNDIGLKNQFKFPLGLDENGNPLFDKKDLEEKHIKVKLGDILLKKVEEKYTISDKLHAGHLRRLKQHKEKGNGFGFSLFKSSSPYTSTISARYYKDGSEIMIEQKGKNPRKLHPKEAAKLQGYPIDKEFEIVVSDAQAYKQFGNSVSVPVVKTLSTEIYNQILKNK
jgi:DNA (cytosine-5)-methyltransferase 1